MDDNVESPEADGLSTRFRLDFVFETVSVDESTRKVTFVAKPNPRRYEWRREGEKTYLYDKFDRLVYSEDVLAQLTEQLKGVPLYYEPQKISDAEAYVQSRRPGILSFLNGERPVPTFADPSDNFLASVQADKL